MPVMPLDSRVPAFPVATIEDLIRQHYSLVHGACARQAPGDEVDDCVQAVFQVLLRRWPRASAARSLEAWLLTVARHVCARAQRAQRRRRRHEHRAAIQYVGGAVEEPVSEIAHHLDACLARLPERQRAVLTLLYLCGRSREDTAAALGLRADALRQLCHRGLQRMRELLRRAGAAVPDEAALAAALAATRLASPPTAPPALLQAVGGALSPHALGYLAAVGVVKLLVTLALVVTGIAVGIPLLWIRSTPAAAPAVQVPRQRTAAADDAVVGPLGDVAHWSITGASAFAPAAIINALRWDVDLAYAMHPDAPRASFLHLLRARLLDGYHHDGFPDAAVAVTDLGDHLAIRIDEQARYACGAIRIAGSTHAGALRAWLSLGGAPSRQQEQTPVDLPPADRGRLTLQTVPSGDPRVPWVAGDPAPFDPQTIDELQRSVTEFFTTAGYTGTRVSVRVITAPTRLAILDVDVSDEGQRSRLGQLEIRGVDASTERAVRALLATPPGTILDPPLLDTFRERLRATARFTTITIAPAATHADPQPLLVTLVPVRASVPPLPQALSLDEQAAVRVAAAMERWGRGLDDRDGVGVLPLPRLGWLTVAIAPRRRAIALILNAANPRACIGLRISAERVEFDAPHARWSHRLDEHALTTLTFAAHTPPDYDEQAVPRKDWVKLSGLLTFTSRSTRGGLLADLTIDPVSLCVLLHHPAFTVTHPQPDEVVCSSHGVEFAFSTTDPHPLPVLRNPQAGLQWRFVRGGLDACGGEDGNEDCSTTESAAAFIATRQIPTLLAQMGYTSEASVVADLATSAGKHLPAADSLTARLSGFFDDGFPLPASSDPVDAAAAGKRAFALMQYGILSSALPAGCWVTRVSRELFLSLSGYGDHLDRLIATLDQDPSVGPCGCLLIGQVLQAIGHADAARHCAMLGSGRVDAEHWQRDLDLLEPCAGIVADIVGDLAHPENAVALVLGHADGEAVAATRLLRDAGRDRSARLHALGRILWDHGLRDRVRDALLRIASRRGGGF